jgi:hypothetical protein
MSCRGAARGHFVRDRSRKVLVGLVLMTVLGTSLAGCGTDNRARCDGIWQGIKTTPDTVSDSDFNWWVAECKQYEDEEN